MEKRVKVVLGETNDILHFTEAQIAQVRAVSPRLDVQCVPQDKEAMRAALADAEVYYGFWVGFEPAWAPRLRWIQLYTAGIDKILNSPLLHAGITVTTTSGIHGQPMTEFVFGLIFAITRKFPLMYRLQTEHSWPRDARRLTFGAEARGKTLGIVGYGRIGKEIAGAGRCFGMRVLGLKRHVGPGEEAGDGTAERIYGPAGLHAMLAECDFVVLTAPLTAETTHLIDEAALHAMKPSAWLINVARGAVVDEDILARALREKWIAGAALDAFVTEPLPPTHPFYDLDNVILTPHVAATTDRYDERALGVFTDNLRRYLAGEPLVNVVDLKKGY